MKQSIIDSAKKRAVATISAAKEVADKWTWPEMTPDQMQSQLEGITGNSEASPPVVGQEDLAKQADAAKKQAESIWLGQLGSLHELTVQGLGMAKSRFRNNPSSLALVKNLHAAGKSPEQILAEALDWETAWNKADPTWTPTKTNTLAAFKALRKSCNEDLQQAFKDAASEARDQDEALAQMAQAVEGTNVAWYAEATKAFGPATPEGIMIRKTIPTTYTAASNKAKPSPAPATNAGKTA